MRKSYILLIILFLFSIVGCSQKELSRSKAEDIILDKTEGEEQSTFNIVHGEFKDYSYHSLNPEYNVIMCLVDKGFLKLENTGYSQYKVTLLPSIKPYILKDVPIEGLSPYYPYRATICLGKRRFKEITGISTLQDSNEANNTIAEFTYNYNLTPVGMAIPENLLSVFGIYPKATGIANFVKYDDGWRLQSIQKVNH